MKVQICRKLAFFIAEDWRYKVAYGGRGASKSWGVADGLLLKAYKDPKRVLCTRELQNSIKDSVHRLLSDRIHFHGLQGFFNVTEHEIRGINGSLFLFKGLRTNTSEIKSLEGVDICWVEEAQKVSRESWELLKPTIRNEDSEIWVTFNTGLETDPVYQMFVEHPPANAKVVKVNFDDNPWFPAVLEEERKHDEATNPNRYKNIWLGEPGGQGRFFPEFGDHLREMPFKIEPHLCNLYGSIDYGDGQGENAGATSFGLWHIDEEGRSHRLFTYYKRHQTAGTYAREIIAAIKSFTWTSGVMPKRVYADPSMFIKRRMDDNFSKSVADIFAEYGLVLTPANNDRINGWRVMREYFVNDETGVPRSFYWDAYNDEYMMYIPALEVKETNPEDVEKGGEDHVGDEARYFFVAAMGMSADKLRKQHSPDSYRNSQRAVREYELKHGGSETGWS